MESQLKQRLLGTVTIVSLAVIFLPILLDGEGYRYLSSRDAATQGVSPRLSIIQKFPELLEHEKEVVVTREQVNAKDFPSGKNWFVHVADRKSIDGASSLVQSLVDNGYKASYRMIAEGGKQTFKIEVDAGQSEADGKAAAMKIRKEYGFDAVLIRR